MRTYLLLFGAVMLLATATAGRDLNLSQALSLAREHSYSLKNADAVHKAALSSLSAARAERFPTLSASAMANYVDYVARFDISLPPPSPSISREVGTHETYQTDLRLNLPLFTGGRISGNISLAVATAELDEALVSAGEDQLAYMTRLEYFTLNRADAVVEVAKASFTRAETIAKDVNSLYQAGAADSVALLEADLAVTRATFALQQAEIARRSSELRLLTYLGLDATEQLSLTDSLPTPQDSVGDATVSSNKPELIVADATVRAGQSRLRLSRTDYFPTITAFGGYSYGKPNLDRFNNTWNDYFTVGATLSWSFNLGRKTAANSRAANFGLEAARMNREQVAENLDKEASLAREQVKLAYRRYQSAREEFRIASDNYRLASAQHRDGTLSSNRLVTIESDLTAAESSLSTAKIDYQIALSAFYYTTGSENLRKGN
ncbi:MAG: TolC family protein [Candidatus Zixiibacteriota bacterium]